MTLEFEPEQIASLKHVRALANVAYRAQSFWETTDCDPLMGLTAEQGELWDALCAAVFRMCEWDDDDGT